jgi:hypothetical protein
MTVPASRIRLISCVGVEHDLPLLPHFLRHYLGLGIEPGRMHLVLHAPSEGAPGLAEAQAVLAAHGVEPYETWTDPYTSDAMWEKRREVQRHVAAPSDWVVSADVDEFCEFPAPLGEALSFCERKGVGCVQGVFVDRLAPGGRLAPVEAGPSVWDQFPVQADVAGTVRRPEGYGYRYGTVNVMALRGDVLPSRGGHAPLGGGPGGSFVFGVPLGSHPRITDPAFRFALPFRVHHFKWTRDLAERHRRRLETPGASPIGSAYGRLLLDHLDRHGGRVGLDEVAVRGEPGPDRVPWRARVAAVRAGVRARQLKGEARRVAGGVKRRVVGWAS